MNKPRYITSVITFSIISMLLLVLTACDTATTTEELPKDSVTVQLKWVHQAQFAGFYVALEEGYYADENLDVTLLPAGIGIGIYEPLINGEADFSIVGADSLIPKILEGVPAKAIATTYRINPFALATFAESGIRTPADLVGRRVSITGMFDEVQFAAMLNQVDVSIDDIIMVPYDDNTQTAFLAGEVDAIGTFIAGAFNALKKQAGDQELNLILPGDFGVHFYSDTIIALDSMINENPDVVLRFLRATLKGHQTAIQNQDLALQDTMRYAVIQDEDVQTDMLIASTPLIYTGEDEIGWMDEAIWQDTMQVLLDENIIDAPVAMSDIFTMQFLTQIYGDNK